MSDIETWGRSVARALVAALVLGFWTTHAPAATVVVDCEAGNSISAALDGLHAGDTLLVSGTCKENVVIPAGAVRITLDGQGKAAIHGPGTGPLAHGVYVRGKGITIRGFTISAGADGIHLSGPAAAVIDGNVIHRSRRGIHVDKGSVVQIINNTIRDNQGSAINLVENSYARIGFLIPPDTALRPNTIQNNGGDGVHIARTSSAWVVGNTITGNKGSGIAVNRSSQADIVFNSISGNGGDGIRASYNSGVNLRSEGTPRREGANRTDPALRNGGVAIRCSTGGYVEGPIGTLLGTLGTTEFDDTCINRAVHP